MHLHYLNNKIQLFTLLTEGAYLITPNKRLSSAYLEEYFEHCGQHTTNKPTCFPYSMALLQAYQAQSFLHPEQAYPLLLNVQQCQYLWRDLIRNEPKLHESEGLLQTLMQAWEHCKLWEVNMHDSAFAITEQTQIFQDLWQQFEKKRCEMMAISEYDIVSYLHVSEETFKKTIWACFDEFNPQQRRLQAQLDGQGIAQYRYEIEEKKSTQPQVFQAKDKEEEYQQLLTWLDIQLKKNHHQIAVVVPDLKQEAKQLKRRLAHYFDKLQCNMSLGQRLSDYPLINHALSWLHFNPEEPISHQEAVLFLQSPYLGESKEEFLKRSQYLQDAACLRHQHLNYRSFLEDLSPQVPQLAKRLTVLHPYPAQASIQEWIKHFQDRLNSLGFPGDYPLLSENFQCFQRFSALFDEFRQLGIINTEFSCHEALAAFEALSNNTVFQAQQKTKAPIQILGLLEASGCEFDSLWIMGLTHQHLPQRTHLSAFIPTKLQQQLAMPHSLPERELRLAEQTLHRLQHSSQSVVLSYPKLQDDLPQMPSPLILDFPAYSPLLSDSSAQPFPLIPQIECYQMPVGSETVSGGTRLLGNQAKCPFKAFAEHRLRAKPIQDGIEGIDGQLKGQIIHHLMELLWRQLKSQEQLLQLSSAALEECIDKALKTALNQLTSRYSSLVIEIEYSRLKQLLRPYLEWEKNRPPFQIEALEQSYVIHLASLPFKLRVDRLDSVGADKWVIDYKSTLVSKPWQEERPKEPQLLVYALLDESINTLLFLQLKPGKIRCSGLTAEEETITGLEFATPWISMRNRWKTQLTELAQEIQDGFCPPQPSHESLCQTCEYQRLCRLKQ